MLRKLSAALYLLVLTSLVAKQTPDPAQAEYAFPTQSERFDHYVSEWEQGARDYARRHANSYAQHIMRQTMMYGAGDLLHEDNRYLPSGRSGTGSRLKYAVESSFLARKRDAR